MTSDIDEDRKDEEMKEGGDKIKVIRSSLFIDVILSQFVNISIQYLKTISKPYSTPADSLKQNHSSSKKNLKYSLP